MDEFNSASFKLCHELFIIPDSLKEGSVSIWPNVKLLPFFKLQFSIEGQRGEGGLLEEEDVFLFYTEVLVL